METLRGAVVEIDADHYWLIDGADALDLNREPKLSVGQISDDVAELRAMKCRASDELIVWYDLKHLVGLLDALASADLPGPT